MCLYLVTLRADLQANSKKTGQRFRKALPKKHVKKEFAHLQLRRYSQHTLNNQVVHDKRISARTINCIYSCPHTSYDCNRVHLQV